MKDIGGELECRTRKIEKVGKETQGWGRAGSLIYDKPEFQKETNQRMGEQQCSKKDTSPQIWEPWQLPQFFSCRVWAGVWLFLLQCLLNRYAG